MKYIKKDVNFVPGKEISMINDFKKCVSVLCMKKEVTLHRLYGEPISYKICEKKQRKL